MDEVELAGGYTGTSNSDYYLYTNQNYWTISPSDYTSNYGIYARVYYIDSSSGSVNNAGKVNTSYGVRPVINLNAGVTLTGDGTYLHPYEVS